MREDFLYFLWQFQCFDKQSLQTTDGRALQVLQTGTRNLHAGPDFSDARLEIDNLVWAGHVEMHLKSSDWDQHRHQHDEAYSNVVLHIVWQHDKTVFRPDGTLLPTLELEGKTNLNLLGKYKSLLFNHAEIPCQHDFAAVKEIYKLQMLDSALMQRLQEKAAFITQLLIQNNSDWEETAYQALARNFGFKVNSDSFLILSQRVPLKIIQKHSASLLQIEALLLGQAGLLNETANDEYVSTLQREYNFLSHKYSLENSRMGAGEWKFARLRPSNFPSLRMAQLAAFLQHNAHIFSTLLRWENASDLTKCFDIQTSAYWKTHYTPGKETDKGVPGFGSMSTQNICINTVAPLLVAYAHAKDNKAYTGKAVSLLESITAEDNAITRRWKERGLPVRNAFDSQASIELYNHFCSLKKCLSCKIGVTLLTQAGRPEIQRLH